MNIDRKRVLVVGGYIMGLGVIRALHLKNIETVAMTYEKIDLAHLSRYVSERVRIPHPAREEKEFVSFLVNNSHRWGGSLILATNDHAAVSIAKNKNILSRYYVVGSPDWEVVRIFIEKEKTYKLADECGVPYPKTFSPKHLRDLRKIEDDITYPCILKPVNGHEFHHVFHTKNFKVKNTSELLEKFKLCLESGHAMMVQEIIPGPDSNLAKMQTYVNSKGELVGKFFLAKLRSNPPPFGVGRVTVSKERNQEVEKLTKTLLTHVGFKGGFCSIEFKQDPRDNKLKLIENNVRLVRNNWLATCCDINFPWLIYTDLVEDRQIDVEVYQENFYWIELYSDIFNSVFRHRREDIKFTDYLRPYLSRNKTFAIFSLYDPMPFLKQTLNLPRLFFNVLTSSQSLF